MKVSVKDTKFSKVAYLKTSRYSQVAELACKFNQDELVKEM